MADERQTRPDDLDRRIAEAKAEHAPKPAHAQRLSETRGWAVGIEFVGAVLVGAFIGWLLDGWLKTSPWLLIVFLVLGFAAGLRRAMATSNRIAAGAANEQR